MSLMSQVKPEQDLPDLEGKRRLRLWPERWRWRISIVLALLIVLTATVAWTTRERIAGSLIDDALTQSGLEASYEIESIGTRQQVITNLAIGDPSLPDLTAERVTLDITYTYGPPEISKVELVRPRLFGKFADGVITFGSLDSLLFSESEEPAGLPSLNVKVVDGRARIASDYGVVGAKIDGEGRLDDGFAGTIAATAPGIGVEGCWAQSATVYGNLTSSSGRLSLDGPVRLREVDCEGNRIALADIGALLTLADDFGSVEGDLALTSSDIANPQATLAKLGGTADFAWSFDGELSLRHDLEGEGLSNDLVGAARVGADGTLRSREGFARNEWAARVSGEGIDGSRLMTAEAILDARSESEGTFLASLLGKLQTGLESGINNSSFAGDISVRANGKSVRLVVPEARLRSSGGETLIALSRLSYNNAGEDQPERLAGNILTGGEGLPQINARFQGGGSGEVAMRMTMAEYRLGNDMITLPRLEGRRDAGGRIRFTGIVQAEGAIPGGTVRGLELPLEGRWSPASGLAFGTRCLNAKIEGLNAYNFSLGPETIALCPIRGTSLVSYRDSLSVSAQLGDMSVDAMQGENPVRVSLSGATLRYPSNFSIQGLEAMVGAQDSALRIATETLEGTFMDGLSGRFTGGNAALDAVPLDLSDLAGGWSFADDVLEVSDGTLTLTDRVAANEGAEARFEPLEGRGISLSLRDGSIRARAALYNPMSGRRVTNIVIRHDLASGRGRAGIGVPGIRFDEGLQPDDLTPLTVGLIAFADGEIKGRGRVEWQGDEITSQGSFSTEGFDFAAAFGPVRGVKGTIEFTDLLSLTTAPAQVASIASVNPGVEALEGRVVYSITNGTLISLNDARWPFMGGELILRPVELDYGSGQGQSYIFEIVALDAATFVAQTELANIGATGEFDGTIPIVFDAQGNGTIQGGLLISRPPGGNVSYVGELTYEDLGAMGNFAFQTLRSLDYNQMSIGLNGNLAGEIVTNFNIDGVRQGEGASQNLLTRQLAKLPIRFKVNVRSENFYTLATIVRGIFDPTVFASAAEVERFVGENIGALEARRTNEEGADTVSEPAPAPVTNSDELQRRNEPPVQPPESENMP